MSHRALDAAPVLDDLTTREGQVLRDASRCHALVHPRRAIRLCAGALCGSHQQSHMHSWLRTMFGHRRPRAEHVGRQNWRGDFRATSDTRVHPK